MKHRLSALAFLASLVFPGAAFAQTNSVQDPPVEVEEVVVTGRRDVEAVARDFVADVGAAPAGRELAVWRGSICVGVVGLQAEAAGAIADRVSDWGHNLGLNVRNPGCKPNILIVAAHDGKAAARALVAAHPRDFRNGSTGADRGESALATFRNSDRPVRWWHVSVPVDEYTLRRTVRLPGEPPISLPNIIKGPADLASAGRPVMGSRLLNQDQDDLHQAVIVLDTAAFNRADFGAVADYLAMVALAQIDAEAAPGVPSILNLFNDGGAAETTLTRWDLAYLRALYDTRIAGPGQNVTMIAAATAREVQATSEVQPTP